nr:MAG: hypothetical protein KatS3mg041_0832 [Bacteroidota bacterium]
MKGWMGLVLLITCTGSLWAQSANLEIRGGRVFINGRELSQQDLPQGFDPSRLDGLRIQVRGRDTYGVLVDPSGKQWIFTPEGQLRPSREAGVRAQLIPLPWPGIPDAEEEIGLAAQRARLQAWEAQMQALEVQLENLLARYRNVLGQPYTPRITPEQRQALEARLRSYLEELFELQQRMYEQQIQTLRQELERVSRSLEERKQRRQQIIERRLRDILGKNE